MKDFSLLEIISRIKKYMYLSEAVGSEGTTTKRRNERSYNATSLANRANCPSSHRLPRTQSCAGHPPEDRGSCSPVHTAACFHHGLQIHLIKHLD